MAISFIPNEPNRDKESLQQLGETFARIAAAREEAKIQKERLKLQEQQMQLMQAQDAREAERAARDTQNAQAQGIAGRAELSLAAFADPSVRSMLMQVAPQTMVNPQAIGQVAAQASSGRAPAPQAMQQMARPNFDAQQVPVEQAAAIADRVRGFRTNEAGIRQADAAAESSRANTRATELAMEHERVLFPLRVQEAETGVAANREAIATSQAQRAEIERRAAQLPIERARERQGQFTQFLQLSGGDAAWASRMAYGTNEPPDFQQLVAEEQNFIARADQMSNGDPALLRNLYDDRDRTRLSQSLGMAPEDQQWVDGAVERLGDPIQIFEMAKDAVGQENSTISEPDIPIIASYLIARYPNFRLKPKDEGFVRSLFARLRVPQAPAAGAGAAPAAPAAPTAANNFGASQGMFGRPLQ
jgi:hypothetical protein